MLNLFTRSTIACDTEKVCCNKPEELRKLQCGFRGEKHPNRTDISIRISFDELNEEEKELYESDLAEFPWMILILRKTGGESDPFGRFATGSLIHTKVVLTAAHSVRRENASNLIARAGDYDIKSNQGMYKIQERVIKTIKKHGSFNKGTFYNDIALLFLSEPFNLEYHIHLLCLPPQGIDFVGSQCAVSGWGKISLILFTA